LFLWGENQMDEKQGAALAKELSELSQNQSEALRTAAYIPMTGEEMAEYDKRRDRIKELCTLLGRYRPL
jgi:phosphoribosylformylglycinamidine (FGAM) synthase PurS component